ncbi:MAG: ABC transporter ATP-binding protein [Spirochaetaceae bacterium]|nr:ABC transporter ATP-binding protein [Spirochaetaceae bacterium]
MQPPIKLSQVTKYYGDFPALQDVSFEIQSGEVVGLLGLNGAGKTTCLRLLTGFLTPSDGTLEVEGQDVTENPLDIRSKLGYLPEVPPLYLELTVHDYLHFVARLRGVPETDFASEFDRVVERTNLQPARRSLIRHLSLGYRKRVGIAQALIGNPSILIFDEPVSGLDPRQIVEVRNLIRELAGQHTILISSHILTEVSRTCDRVLILHRGKLAAGLEGSQLESDLESEFMKHTAGAVEVGV